MNFQVGQEVTIVFPERPTPVDEEIRLPSYVHWGVPIAGTITRVWQYTSRSFGDVPLVRIRSPEMEDEWDCHVNWVNLGGPW